MKKSILITSLLMLLCLTVSAQKNKSANKFKEGTSEYYAYEGEKLLKQDKIDEAKAAWKQARMAKQISCDEICLGGDIYLKENNQEMAMKQYRRAIYFDRKNEKAYFRIVNMLKAKQMPAAVALLDTLGHERHDLPIQTMIADLYYDNQDFSSALKIYDSMSRDTMSDRTLMHYATCAYFTQNYDLTITLANLGHVRNSRDAVFNRFRLYGYTDKGMYQDALTAANDLFYNSDSLKVQYIDYFYYGYALNGMGRTADAVKQFDRAAELSQGQRDISKELSDAYLKIHQYDQAAHFYELYMKNEKDDYNRVYNTNHLGYIWYTKANNDTTLTKEQKIETLKKAIIYFHQIEVYEPDNYLGYLFEARCNTVIDENSKQGLAKPFYSKVIELTQNDASHQSYFIEACQYMAYYNYIHKNFKGSHEFAEKILAVDPNNMYAIQIAEATK